MIHPSSHRPVPSTERNVKEICALLKKKRGVIEEQEVRGKKGGICESIVKAEQYIKNFEKTEGG